MSLYVEPANQTFNNNGKKLHRPNELTMFFLC